MVTKSLKIGVQNYGTFLWRSLDLFPAEADLVVVGMVGELVEVNVVSVLHQHVLKFLKYMEIFGAEPSFDATFER